MAEPVPQPADDIMQAWRNLLLVHHQLTGAMDDELRRRHDLRLDWYDVLVQLNAAGGRLRMSDLAEATLFSRTDCTRIVDRMEEAGLVARERATEDGRGVYATLTVVGKAMLRRAAVTHLRQIRDDFASHLAEGDAAAIAVALGRVAAASTT